MARKRLARRAVDERQRERRWVQGLLRLDKKRRVLAYLSSLSGDSETESLQRRYYSSIPLKLMASRCAEVLPIDAISAGKFVAPKIFSLHHNPQETLRGIYRIAKYARSARSTLRITLDMRGVKKMDLGADSLLAIVLKEVKNECFGVRKSKISGNYPDSEELRREMDEIGTVKVLKSEPGADNVEVSFSREDFKVYRHRETGVEITRSVDASDTVQIVTKEFADHVNNCLRTIGFELNETGRRNICDYVGEVLTNAQEHAGMTDWTIVGYFDTSARVFKTVVINFGASFEETFLSLDRESYTWQQQVAGYVARHRDLAQRKHGMAVGSLLTVAALQERISCKNVDRSGTRGQGTVAMIEFFQRVHQICSGKSNLPVEMALISGSTHIVFDGRYVLAKNEKVGRDVIAFNPGNDLDVLPDPSVVKTMPGVSFPGTIISISFPLDEQMQIREVEQ